MRRTIVITGATGRLGSEIKQGFERASDRVVTIGRGQSEDIRADLTSESSTEAAFRQIDSAHAVVHTVGMWAGSPLLDTSAEDWERILRINLTSTFLCFREGARLLTRGGGGRLIGIASSQGADRGVASQAGYSASKAGVIRLAEAVNAEFEDRGVTAHVIAPSFILYGTESSSQDGVAVGDLVELTQYLCTDAGVSLGGATLRAYGSLLP